MYIYVRIYIIYKNIYVYILHYVTISLYQKSHIVFKQIYFEHIQAYLHVKNLLNVTNLE